MDDNAIENHGAGLVSPQPVGMFDNRSQKSLAEDLETHVHLTSPTQPTSPAANQTQESKTRTTTATHAHRMVRSPGSEKSVKFSKTPVIYGSPRHNDNKAANTGVEMKLPGFGNLIIPPELLLEKSEDPERRLSAAYSAAANTSYSTDSHNNNIQASTTLPHSSSNNTLPPPAPISPKELPQQEQPYAETESKTTVSTPVLPATNVNSIQAVLDEFAMLSTEKFTGNRSRSASTGDESDEFLKDETLSFRRTASSVSRNKETASLFGVDIDAEIKVNGSSDRGSVELSRFASTMDVLREDTFSTQRANSRMNSAFMLSTKVMGSRSPSQDQRMGSLNASTTSNHGFQRSSGAIETSGSVENLASRRKSDSQPSIVLPTTSASSRSGSKGLSQLVNVSEKIESMRSITATFSSLLEAGECMRLFGRAMVYAGFEVLRERDALRLLIQASVKDTADHDVFLSIKCKFESLPKSKTQVTLKRQRPSSRYRSMKSNADLAQYQLFLEHMVLLFSRVREGAVVGKTLTIEY